LVFLSPCTICCFAAKVGGGSEKQKNCVLFGFSLALHYLLLCSEGRRRLGKTKKLRFIWFFSRLALPL
jgi:hypothetical protein